MGVPKFFRYISERYPCLSELAREQCIPQFDNLYLDMNGIIHNCSHPDDGNIHFNITEEEMFKDIFNYISKLFFLIKPQKLFFLAVDGVAPRAKMNQQRSRRFRSAKDAEILEEKAKNRGEVRKTERFDSNCITPGTIFMVRLHEALRSFIRSKISQDSLWKKCRVILSGHNYPGEGEHKIMDYIRYLKSQKNYDPNTRHCLYGLDADLIILGLCTHELNFVVLREEVKFGSKTKRASVEETRFFLLHLGLLKEYLEMEFKELQQSAEDFDIAKLIDDWILMGFLVGNDFVPHLPCMHINTNALPLLYKTYIQIYPKLGGNINENGRLHLERLEHFFTALGEVEYDIFVQNNDNLKYLSSKMSKNGIDEAFDFEVSEINNENIDKELEAFIESSEMFFKDKDVDSSDEEQHLAEEFEAYKRNYYMNKLDQNEVSSKTKHEQVISYIRTLQWILDYYYRGVQSWDWYYPYHYAPFVTDLRDFKDLKIHFNLGKPFLPFEQLLAVLPAASKELLPAAYRDLMTSCNSELIDFYPTDFKTDLNGKQHEWEAVVLIPFIDEKKLLQAMRKCEGNLTQEEKLRNTHGSILQFDHNDQNQVCAANNTNCSEIQLSDKDIAVISDKTMCVEFPNTARNVFFPGFPTMKHLKYQFKIFPARVKVFEQYSRNENLILLPERRTGLDNILTVAEKYLNQIVFIGWPHLIKAKVVAVSDEQQIIDSEGIKTNDPKIYHLQVKEAESHLKTRMGIEFNDFSVLVHVKTYVGSTYLCGKLGKITVTDTWNQAMTSYPAQGVVAEIAVFNNIELQHKKVEDLFPINTTVFFIGNPYYGSKGTVLDPMKFYDFGRLSVRITVLIEPDLQDAKKTQNQLDMDYCNTYQAASKLSITSKCLSRITGSVLVISGYRRAELPETISKTNIGLQMRYPKQQEERAGYVRRINNQWFYSSKALDIIQLYIEKFPNVFSYLNNSNSSCDVCFESDIFADRIEDKKIDEIAGWIKTLDHMQLERVPCGSKTVDKESLLKIISVVDNLQSLPKKTVKLQVKPHLLLKPDITLPYIYKARRPIKLFDRIVVVKTIYMVPLGLKGTVVGIQPVTDPNPVRLECIRAVNNFYEILFDNVIPNGNDLHGIAQQRVYKVPESAVLLIYVNDTNCSHIPQQGNFNSSDYIPNNNASQPNSIQTQVPTSLLSKDAESPNQSDKANINSAFWEPTKNTRKKHEKNVLAVNPYNKSSPCCSNQQYLQSQGSVVDSSLETQALKNLLGLSIELNKNEERPINVVNCQKLPQPPHSWKNSVQDNFKAPALGSDDYEKVSSHLQLRSIPYSDKTLHQNNRDLTNSNIALISNNTKRNIPSQSFHQKGAFIPLQAQRAAHHRNVKPNLGQGNGNINNTMPQANSIYKSPFPRQSDDQRHQNTSSSQSPSKPTNDNKKTIRISKIAAKFDFAN